jgi:putative nucleotidyltransferase with HDIG domain
MIDINAGKTKLPNKKKLDRNQQAIDILIACQRGLVRANKSHKLFQMVCEQIIRLGDYRMAWIGMARNDDGKSVQPMAYAGSVDKYLESIKLSWKVNGADMCPAGKTILTGKPAVITDILTDEGIISWRGEALKQGYASVLALPLLNEGKAFGSLCIYSGESDVFIEEEVKYFTELADSLVYGIMALQDRNVRCRVESELETNLNKLRKTLGAIIQAFEHTIEIRDPYTAGHQRRVADLARAIATEIGLSQDMIDGIRIAGIIHDIGKIYIPAEILSSPRSLTAMEFNLVKSHPQVGYDLLKAIEFPWPVAMIIKQHHERIDGSGYPKNLKGKDIMIEAKILAVADVVEAMASHRPYRPALGLDKALDEIRKNSGILYDTRIVNACLKIFKNGEFDFSETEGFCQNFFPEIAI